MLNDAGTKAGHESKDLENALKRIVPECAGMSWLIVERDTNRIIGATYTMKDAREIMPANTMVKCAYTGRIVAVKAAKAYTPIA